MYITVDPYLALLICNPPHQLLGVENLRIKKLIRLHPLPIQINARNRVPIVAADDPVWVQARHQDEGVVESELLRFLLV